MSPQLDCKELTMAIGMEVRGIQLTEVADADIEALKTLAAERGELFFRE